MHLLASIEQRKMALRLSDAEVARRLQISPAYWAQIKNGNRRITVRVVRGIIAGFPELAMDAWDWLRVPSVDLSADEVEAEAAS